MAYDVIYVKVTTERERQMLLKYLSDNSFVDQFDIKYDDKNRILYPNSVVEIIPKDNVAIQLDSGVNVDSEISISVAEFLWNDLENVPVNNDSNIDCDWNIFEAGTDREYIWHFFEEELGVSVAKLMEGLVPISIKASNRTYYTLRRGNATEEDILKDADGNIKEFTTYEEAFDQMVNIYNHSLYGKHYTYADNPVRYKIWRTQVSYCEGKESSMTMQV